jgi:hypothetical protein
MRRVAMPEARQARQLWGFSGRQRPLRLVVAGDPGATGLWPWEFLPKVWRFSRFELRANT